jgi:hypothetical protein
MFLPKIFFVPMATKNLNLTKTSDEIPTQPNKEKKPPAEFHFNDFTTDVT